MSVFLSSTSGMHDLFIFTPNIVSIWIPPNVYFNQCLVAVQSKCWSKYAFYKFCTWKCIFTSFANQFGLIFHNFCIKNLQKTWKSRFQPGFGVRSTQLLVEIYNKQPFEYWVSLNPDFIIQLTFYIKDINGTTHLVKGLCN